MSKTNVPALPLPTVVVETGPKTKSIRNDPQHVVPETEVEIVWNASDPNTQVQRLLLDWLSRESGSRSQDLQKWDEFEQRFEPSELGWISNFIVQNLIFCKSKLQLTTDAHIAQTAHVLWKTLDLLGESQEIKTALATRFSLLQGGLTQLFTDRVLNKSQVVMMMDYARQFIFGHLQLYSECLRMKKQQSKSMTINIFEEVPRQTQNLETECREIVVERPMTTEQENIRPPTQESLVADLPEFFDPNDPLYGLNERLKGLKLDPETHKVVKTKLIEVSDKIQAGLEKRRADLEARVTLAMAPPAKKK